MLSSGPQVAYGTLIRRTYAPPCGKFKNAPSFLTWGCYGARARFSGFAAPRALPECNAAGKYEASRCAFRANIGKAAADMDRMATMNIWSAPSGRRPLSPHGVGYACRYPQLGRSVWRRVQQPDVRRIRATDAEFRLLAKLTPPPIAYIPIEYVVAGSWAGETQFAGGEQCASRMQKRTTPAVGPATRGRARRSI